MSKIMCNFSHASEEKSINNYRIMLSNSKDYSINPILVLRKSLKNLDHVDM
jgi:hypothetical protein